MSTKWIYSEYRLYSISKFALFNFFLFPIWKQPPEVLYKKSCFWSFEYSQENTYVGVKQIFMKNIKKLIVSKAMKYNKNADTLLFLLLFTTGQREKILKKHYSICECRRSKKVKNSGFWEYFTTISTES